MSTVESRVEHIHAPAPHTRKQIDAYTETADCGCGVRIEQVERWIGDVTYVWPWRVIA